MNQEKKPRLSIGMPVYNGEHYVGEALDGLLAQSFRDFELIISDNASTDSTGEICQSYAARDPRVRYYRHPTNVGPRKNFHRVFELANCEYFKWAHHDDRLAPEFLLRCVEVLERDPSVAVSYSRALVINEEGSVVSRREYGLDTSLERPSERLAGILRIGIGSPPICGVMRTSMLKKTPLLSGNYASDQVLLAELGLRGRFHEVPEDLLLHRDHAKRSVFVAPSRHALASWFDPSQAGRILFPVWGLLSEYISAVLRVPLTWTERFHCMVQLAKWTKYHWREMAEDLAIAAKQIFARVMPVQKRAQS
jgi:glycosyltransferase involved in cell wall biosynthesis